MSENGLEFGVGEYALKYIKFTTPPQSPPTLIQENHNVLVYTIANNTDWLNKEMSGITSWMKGKVSLGVNEDPNKPFKVTPLF